VIAAKDFADESLDCIFIDGDHRYEEVMKDLEAWFPKLKKGHLMIGDDYWMDQVAKAVETFFSSHEKKVFFLNAQSGYKLWAVYK
jgi:predicted O-methyltransferase YrrM